MHSMYHKQGDAFQFMTPSMLVKLKDLRNAEQTIFIVATNYYERIDPAARRVGRVDHRYLVMPPCREQRAPNRSRSSEGGDAAKRQLPETLRHDVRTDSRQNCFVRIQRTEVARSGRSRRSRRPRTGADVARLMLQAAKEGDPTIRVATYRDRFHALLKESDSEVLTTQQPIEEFLGHLELLQESGRLSEAAIAGSQGSR